MKNKKVKKKLEKIIDITFDDKIKPQKKIKKIQIIANNLYVDLD